MGRHCYFSNGVDHKFGLGCQCSTDVQTFGGEEAESDYIRWQWCENDMPAINKRIREVMSKFKEIFPTDWRFAYKYIYRSQFIEDDKTYALFATLQLGNKIRKGLRQEGYLSCEAEC